MWNYGLDFLVWMLEKMVGVDVVENDVELCWILNVILLLDFIFWLKF